MNNEQFITPESNEKVQFKLTYSTKNKRSLWLTYNMNKKEEIVSALTNAQLSQPNYAWYFKSLLNKIK